MRRRIFRVTTGNGKPLHILMAMVGLVLLIALTNVVMLLMARNSTRQREFSLRLALGARRGELLRQLLTESLLLVAMGGALAWGFAEIATRTLGRWAHIESSLAPDTTVLLFTLGVLDVAAVLFGLAPFRVAVAGGAELALKTSAATSRTDAGKTRTGRIIVAVADGAVRGAAGRWWVADPDDEEPREYSTGDADGGAGGVWSGSAERAIGSGAIAVLSGDETEAAGAAGGRSRDGDANRNRIGVVEQQYVWWMAKMEPASGTSTMKRSNDVGPDFFHTLGVPILMGREFTDADTATSQKVAVVNELFAQRFLPNQSPLGHHSSQREDDRGCGEEPQIREHDEDPIPMIWYDYAQSSEGAMHVEMRVQGDPMAILPAAQKVVAQMDPNVPLTQPMLQRAQFEQTISQQLMFARLAEFFGLLAVVLVATGLYGTLAYRVNMRTAEIGVRMAVGARREQVVWMILRDSLLLTLVGVVVGVPLAMMVGKELTSSLYGVKPFDTLSYVLAVVGVAIVALAASAVPAGRAASVDPLTALRTE